MAAACVLASYGTNDLMKIVDPFASMVPNTVAANVVLAPADKKLRRERLKGMAVSCVMMNDLDEERWHYTD
jgi:hypothetical protein